MVKFEKISQLVRLGRPTLSNVKSKSADLVLVNFSIIVAIQTFHDIHILNGIIWAICRENLNIHQASKLAVHFIFKCRVQLEVELINSHRDIEIFQRHLRSHICIENLDVAVAKSRVKPWLLKQNLDTDVDQSSERA